MHPDRNVIYTFIVNPQAGRGRFSGDALERAARASGLDCRLEYTRHRRHAAELARAAASYSDVVVAVGGDGTIHEVVSGLLRATSRAHLGIIPAGTGNDFAKMFDLPADLHGAVALFSTTPPGRVDVGRVSWQGPRGAGSAVFVNAAGAGIDAKVAAAASAFKLLRGRPRYLAGALQALWSWESSPAHIELSCGGRRVLHVEEAVLLALVGNGRCVGGAFYLTPGASIADGRLDACVVRAAPARRIASLLLRVLNGGRHEGEPEVVLRKVDEVEIRTSVPVPVQADGEVLTPEATTIRFSLVPGGVSVVMPVKR